MNRFPKQILIDFDFNLPYIEVVEQAIDEALEFYNGNYNFDLQSEGVHFGIGNMNFAYFNVEYSKELDVGNLIYSKWR